MTTSTQQTFPNAAAAKAAGNFSRRHRDRTAHDNARLTPSNGNPAAKVVRREAAIERQELRKALGDENQLKMLVEKFPGGAVKEKAKLMARIASKPKAPSPPKPSKGGKRDFKP